MNCSAGWRLHHQPDGDAVGCEVLDAPHLGLLEDLAAHVGSCQISSATRLISACELDVGAVGHRHVEHRAAHCWLMFPTRSTVPLGTCHTVPFTDRSLVARSDTASTVPAWVP